jgi:hypothetical protein
MREREHSGNLREAFVGASNIDHRPLLDTRRTTSSYNAIQVLELLLCFETVRYEHQIMAEDTQGVVLEISFSAFLVSMKRERLSIQPTHGWRVFLVKLRLDIRMRRLLSSSRLWMSRLLSNKSVPNSKGHLCAKGAR